eukprot:TRINITY_DN143_c0_g1_i2.p1 TRINITY_DN143_c0_g1~~TRINITY_DN143_c0_g1_i2.p1  ORF type:complete len:606 (+),score=237.83 TRINITY_DN143_c0_g1_i2:58-1875(+)
MIILDTSIYLRASASSSSSSSSSLSSSSSQTESVCERASSSTFSASDLNALLSSDAADRVIEQTEQMLTLPAIIPPATSRVLYVCQREFAVAKKECVDVICSGDATTCCIVFLRSPKTGKTACAHFDGAMNQVGGVRCSLEAMIKAANFDEKEMKMGIETHLIGAFCDGSTQTQTLLCDLLNVFVMHPSIYFRILTLCVDSVNTRIIKGKPYPRLRDVGLELSTGEVRPLDTTQKPIDAFLGSLVAPSSFSSLPFKHKSKKEKEQEKQQEKRKEEERVREKEKEKETRACEKKERDAMFEGFFAAYRDLDQQQQKKQHQQPPPLPLDQSAFSSSSFSSLSLSSSSLSSSSLSSFSSSSALSSSSSSSSSSCCCSSFSLPSSVSSFSSSSLPSSSSSSFCSTNSRLSQLVFPSSSSSSSLSSSIVVKLNTSSSSSSIVVKLNSSNSNSSNIQVKEKNEQEKVSSQQKQKQAEEKEEEEEEGLSRYATVKKVPLNRGPEFACRCAYSSLGVSPYLLNIYDTEKDQIVIPPFAYRSVSQHYVRHVLSLSDDALLHNFSTSPEAEGPNFIGDVKAAYQFAADHPTWQSYFANNKPRVFRRDTNNQWQRC